MRAAASRTFHRGQKQSDEDSDNRIDNEQLNQCETLFDAWRALRMEKKKSPGEGRSGEVMMTRPAENRRL